MKIGARNRLEGDVTEIKRGTVMCQVKVKIAGGEITGALSGRSANTLLMIVAGAAVRAIELDARLTAGASNAVLFTDG